MVNEDILGAYEVRYNDWGTCYVLAKDFADAEDIFRKSGFGGEFPRIKEIKLLGRGVHRGLLVQPPTTES